MREQYPGNIGAVLEEHKGISKAEESALIQRIVLGEKELFHVLIRPHERNIYLTAYSVLQNTADAEDVAQEASLKAFRGLQGFRGDSKFSTWLSSITLNEARMRLRKVKNVSFQSIDAIDDGENLPGDYTPAFLTDWRPVPSQALEQAELRQMIHDAISTLPDIYREILVLRDVQGLNIFDTAAALNLSENVVKIRLFRARIRMQQILAPKLNKMPIPAGGAQ